jgi:hypothetical protein
MTVPDGAQRSEDGHYWWDAGANEWKAVPTDDPQHPQNAGSTPAPAAGSTPAPGAGGDPAGGGAAGAAPTHEELAQVQSVDQLNDERIKPYFQPDSGSVPDDLSNAQVADVLSEPTGAA